MRDSCTWKIGGPKTFRLASTKILGEFGGNIQNIEKSMRIIYTGDGYTDTLKDKCSYYMASGGNLSVFTEEDLFKLRVLVQTDQSGAEALAVAYLCKDGDFRQLFIHGVKPHVYVALHIFRDVWKRKMRELKLTGDIPCDIDSILNTKISELKLNPHWKTLDRLIKDSDNWSISERYYYLAKQTCHSANYGITPGPFRMNILEKSGGKIVVSPEDGEKFLMTYHALFPEIQDWHRRLRRQVEDTKMMYNLHGHPYTVTSHDIEENKWKELFSWIPQSTIGMITNIAFAQLQTFCETEGKRWDNLINGHDSIVSQCPLGEEKICGLKQREYIEQSFVSPYDNAPFSMRSETQYGFNWAPFKEGKDGKPDYNKYGLREMSFK